ncbi:MAG: NAD(P)-dependent oxidoreductase [Planctomycetota bacterium]|nr:NAD(P)-dependent oxidoreductase [Planctomycetota bacterium]
MKIVVTGCNGRLGQASCEQLLAAGHVVAGIDAVAAAGRPHKVIIDTLLDPFALHRAFDALGGSADAVVHLANHTNSMVAPPEVVLRENGMMNTSVFMAAWQAGVARVIFASSIQAMMGGVEADGQQNQRLPSRLPIDETYPGGPTNVYGLSKILAERSLDLLCDPARFPRGDSVPPMTAVSLRVPFIQPPKGFEMGVVRNVLTDFIWGGAECYAYIARDDAAEAVRLAVEAPTSGHEVVWCAAPDPRIPETIPQLVQRFYRDVPGVEECLRRDSLMNCDKAERMLGWRATRVMRDERARRGIPPVVAPAGA